MIKVRWNTDGTHATTRWYSGPSRDSLSFNGVLTFRHEILMDLLEVLEFSTTPELFLVERDPSIVLVPTERRSRGPS
jgi:hypothetical protein